MANDRPPEWQAPARMAGDELPVMGLPQTGKTTKQMLEAPRGAAYIWVNDSLGYPKHLARSLGRTDLEIKPPGYLSGNRVHGINKAVIVDHAAWLRLTREQLRAYTYHRERMEVKNAQR